MDVVSKDGVFSPVSAIEPYNELSTPLAPFAPYARLEASPDDTARRHLGAAMAAGQTPEIAGPALTALPSRRGLGIGRMAAALLVLAGLGAGAWVMLSEDRDVELAVVSPLPSVAPVIEPIKITTYVPAPPVEGVDAPVEPVAVAQAVPEEVLVAPNVLAAAPEVPTPVVEDDIFAELSHIEPVNYALNVEPAVLPSPPAEDSTLIVFLEVPKRAAILSASNVEQPELPVLQDVKVSFEQFAPITAQTDDVHQHAPVVLASIAADGSPVFSALIPARPRSVVEPVQEASLPLVITTYTPQPVAQNISTSRNAPRNSLRPLLAPPNRRAIAASQIGRRQTRTARAGQIGQAIQAEIVAAPQTTLEQPVHRPELIRPKRRGLGRLFGGLGAQRVTTIETFASENSD